MSERWAGARLGTGEGVLTKGGVRGKRSEREDGLGRYRGLGFKRLALRMGDEGD